MTRSTKVCFPFYVTDEILFRFTPKMIPINQDIPLYGVVGGMEVGMKPNCDLNLLTDKVKRNIDVMFIKH